MIRRVLQITPASPGWWASNSERSIYPVAFWVLVEERDNDGPGWYVSCDQGSQDGYWTCDCYGADACWYDPRPAAMEEYLATIDEPKSPPGGPHPGESDAGPPPLSRREGRGPAELPRVPR